MAKDKLICNCNLTMPLDGKALARALKLDGAPRLSSELCRKHLATFEAAVRKGGDLVVACTQEAPLFGELHEELKGEGGIQFVNIRETAGWSAEAKNATPKKSWVWNFKASVLLRKMQRPVTLHLMSHPTVW